MPGVHSVRQGAVRLTDIFLSYGREDQQRAQRIAEALEHYGWSVFWDRTIPAGKTWRDVIGGQLDEARCVIVLWSATSVHKQWVLEEADRANKRKKLIPVLIDEVEPPLGFSAIQAASLVSWQGDPEAVEFLQFTADVRSILGNAQAKTKPSLPEKDPMPVRRQVKAPLKPGQGHLAKYRWGIYGLAALSVLVVGYLIYLRVSAPQPPGTINALLAKAENALVDGRLTEPPPDDNAMAYYREVLNLDPDNRAAREGYSRIIDRLLAKADAAMEEGDWDEADRALDAAEASYQERNVADTDSRELPGHPAPGATGDGADNALVDQYLERAYDAMDKGDRLQAQVYLQRADRLAPESREVQVATARIDPFLRGETELAVAVVEAAAIPDSAELVRRARIAMEDADLDTAERLLDQAASTDPDLPALKVARQELQGAREQAESAASQERQRAEIQALVRKADESIKAERFVDAKNWLARADKVQPDSPEVAAARQRLQQAQPDSPLATINKRRIEEQARLAREAMEIGDLEAAEKFIQSAERFGANARTMEELHSSLKATRQAQAEANRKRQQEAARVALEEALEGANKAMADGDWEGTNKYLQRARDIAPDSDQLQRAEIRLKRAREAATAASTATGQRQVAPTGDWVEILSVSPPSGTELTGQRATLGTRVGRGKRVYFEMKIRYFLKSADDAVLMVRTGDTGQNIRDCDGKGTLGDGKSVPISRGQGEINLRLRWNASGTGYLAFYPSIWSTSGRNRLADFGQAPNYCYPFRY